MKDYWRGLWVAALRSGDFEQCRGGLKDVEGEEVMPDGSPGCRYCVLGLLCEVFDRATGVCRWSCDERGVWTHGGVYGMPSDALLAEVGLSAAQASALASMNDEGLRFPELADAIEGRVQ